MGVNCPHTRSIRLLGWGIQGNFSPGIGVIGSCKISLVFLSVWRVFACE